MASGKKDSGKPWQRTIATQSDLMLYFRRLKCLPAAILMSGIIMRKAILFIACAAFALTVSCSKGKTPDDAVKIASDTYTLTEAAADRLAKAGTAQDAADALVVFAVERKKIDLRKMQLLKKNPDYLKRTREKYAELDKKNEASAKALAAAVSQTVMRFAGSKELSDAIMKISDPTEKKK